MSQLSSSSSSSRFRFFGAGKGEKMSLFPSPTPQALCSFHPNPSSPPSLFLRLSPNPNLYPYSRSLTSRRFLKPSACVSASADPNPEPKPKGRRRRNKTEPPPQVTEAVEAAPTAAPSSDAFPSSKPRKPMRERRSEPDPAVLDDFVIKRLQETFASIRDRNPDVLEGKPEVLKERRVEKEDTDREMKGEAEEDTDREMKGEAEEEMVMEEDDPNWPLDAEVGWGVRASEYFEKHPIKNVVEDGLEIDWEGEMDEGWVKEINCLEWESFAFHPSPLVVLVFERYKRATHNWKLLQELEKAAKVYWNAKDRLPPRTIKIDMNIETDLAYALDVKECPQLLFLKGNKILYREKEFRTADELVQMIAHFYYNAKKPSCVDAARVSSPF
ncbi:hypothetical protein Cni_G08698 [Canna indica]|uniref:Uncharacterized protein n=1 Tax=Canna indica TaxID=4628 RepID=A0AAQ3K4K0_9LILI|nr:hypothetical protein Cni_G08698 [Canna indica]